jgi:hypothetical protein
MVIGFMTICALCDKVCQGLATGRWFSNDIISKGEFEQVNVLDYRRTCGCYVKFSHLPNIKDLGLFRFHGT